MLWLPVACKKEADIAEGKYAGLHMQSMEYESAWALGAMCDSGDIGAIAAMINRGNGLGLDTIEAGNALSMTMEAIGKGLVGGLAWGDTDAMMETIPGIAPREGIGYDLTERLARADVSALHVTPFVPPLGSFSSHSYHLLRQYRTPAVPPPIY